MIINQLKIMKNKDKNLLIILLTFGFILTLFLFAFAEIPIYCPHEKILLYYYQNDEISLKGILRAEDFKPANDLIPQPQENSEMVCPICGSPLNGYEWFAFEKKMKPTVMIYKAITLLTKDESGNFKFVPYDFQPEDWEGKH